MSQRESGRSVLDMEFPVEIWLASEQVRLERLLKLEPGEVIALAGNPEETVDVVANGITLATGELVVVEGKFGVRVTSTATQRLAQLESNHAEEGSS